MLPTEGEALRDVFVLRAKSRAFEERRIGMDTLCASCRFGHIYRRKGQLSAVVVCNAIGSPVPPDIVECSRHIETGRMDLNEMELMALNVDARVTVHDGSYR